MNFEVAKDKAINYIGISKKTSHEVFLKLKNAGCEDEICNRVIKYLEELGYIDDKDYVDAYIRQNMRLLKYSVYEIKQKLLQKGINKDIISAKLEKLVNSTYEKNVVDKLMNSKLKSQDRIKSKQYLYRRGFNNTEEEV